MFFNYKNYKRFYSANNIRLQASSLAVLVFEVPVSVPLSGIELYKQFVAANLGTLISQRLLENEDKIRYEFISKMVSILNIQNRFPESVLNSFSNLSYGSSRFLKSAISSSSGRILFISEWVAYPIDLVGKS